MSNGNNINILDLYFRKKKGIIKTTDHLLLKKPIPTKFNKTNNHPLSRNKSNIPREISKEKSHLFEINKEHLMKLKIDKYKKILLPSLSTYRPTYKSTKNSKINKNIKESKRQKPINMKKINVLSLSHFFKNKKNKKYNRKLEKLYKEDFVKKKNLEQFKDLKKMHFSFENYNIKLLQLSSIDISEDNFLIFKKNMNRIQNAMNGKLTQTNKFNSFHGNKNETSFFEKVKRSLSFSDY